MSEVGDLVVDVGVGGLSGDQPNSFFDPRGGNPLTGFSHSAQMHTVERYTLDPATNRLTRAYAADDSLYVRPR